MKRVEITRPMASICGMQVCAVKDATNEEILDVCNKQNPSGTSNGWSVVVRAVEEDSMFETKDNLPVQCENHSNRLHFIVLC